MVFLSLGDPNASIHTIRLVNRVLFFSKFSLKYDPTYLMTVKAWYVIGLTEDCLNTPL